MRRCSSSRFPGLNMIFAPSGTKSSIMPSLRNIMRFDPSWVIPEPEASRLRRLVTFEILDQQKTAKDSNQIKEAVNASIVGVQFDDSTKYVVINYANRQVAKVVSQRNYNFLLCVTTVDMDKYNEETRGGTNLPFFEIDGGGFSELQPVILETDGDKWEDSKGYPLKDQYFFSVKGTIVPANETAIKPYISPDFKEAFKNKMADRWWSWKNPENLKDILLFLPQ